MALNSKPLFHPGGSLTPSGRIGTRPSKGKFYSRQALIEKIVRLDQNAAITGLVIPDTDIARVINRSPRTVQTIRRDSEYLRMRIEVQTGVSLNSDKNFDEIRAFRVQYFKDSLPTALKAIVAELERPAVTIQERKLKVELAKDFLDREGSFPRISRTDSHVKVEHDYSNADSLAEELLLGMDSPVQNSELDPKLNRILNANMAFSSSETISHTQQEEALATLELITPLTNAIN